MENRVELDPAERPRKPGTFVKGFDPRRDTSNLINPPRRQPGSPNAITRDLKRGIIDAAERHGSDGKGTDGLTGYLFHLAGKHPKAFAGLLGKILPLQVSGNVGQFIGTVNVISVPADNYLSADDIVKLTAPVIDQENESQNNLDVDTDTQA
jgi:hypothetical protein